MNAVSCSSSTTTSPRSGNGRNSADRAPTTTGAPPSATARHVVRRVRDDRSLCQTAGATPNRRMNRSSHCDDSAISGSSTSACRPAATHSATASRYTSVFPDPVTPSSNATPNARAATIPRNAPAACPCATDNAGPG